MNFSEKHGGKQGRNMIITINKDSYEKFRNGEKNFCLMSAQVDQRNLTKEDIINGKGDSNPFLNNYYTNAYDKETKKPKLDEKGNQIKYYNHTYLVNETAFNAYAKVIGEDSFKYDETRKMYHFPIKGDIQVIESENPKDRNPDGSKRVNLNLESLQKSDYEEGYSADALDKQAKATMMFKEVSKEIAKEKTAESFSKLDNSVAVDKSAKTVEQEQEQEIEDMDLPF